MTEVQTRPRPRLKLPPLSNPFVFRLGSTGAGIGIGCGIGVGVGKPINLRGVPGGDGIMAGVGQVASAARPVAQQAVKLAKKLGLKHLDAGAGCGIGVGYGFGAGLFLKPGVGESLVGTAKEGMAYLKEEAVSRFNLHLGDAQTAPPEGGQEPVTSEPATATKASSKSPKGPENRLLSGTLPSPTVKTEDLGSLESESTKKEAQAVANSVGKTGQKAVPSSGVLKQGDLQFERDVLHYLVNLGNKVRELEESDQELYRVLGLQSRPGGVSKKEHAQDKTDKSQLLEDFLDFRRRSRRRGTRR